MSTPQQETDSTLMQENELRLRLAEIEKAEADGEALPAEKRLLLAKLELMEAEAEMERIRLGKVRAQSVIGRLIENAAGRISFGSHYGIARVLQAEPEAKVRPILYEDNTVIEVVELTLGGIEFEATLPQRPATPEERVEIERKFARRYATRSAETAARLDEPHVR